MSTVTMLSIMGTALSVFNSIAPIKAILDRVKSKELAQIPEIFLNINHLCQLIWLYYSIKKQDIDLIIVNGLTSLLTFIGLFLYNYHSNKLNSLRSQYLIGFIIASFFSYVSPIELLGSVCLIVTFLTSLSTLESLQKVLKTKNYKFIDITMTSAGLLNATVWTWFGRETNDFNVAASSGFNVILGIGLILTYLYYYNSKQSKYYIN
jgi:uncharacterized protein with PQ loop repeat